MLIACFGDTHGWLDLMVEKALAWQERTGLELDYIFQVGDFGIWPSPETVDKATAKHAGASGQSVIGDFRSYAIGEKTFPIPIYFINGNHESQSFLRYHELIQQALYPEDFWTRSIQICPNLNYIPSGHIIEISKYRPVRYALTPEVQQKPGSIRVAGLGGNFSYRTWEQRLEYWKVQGRRMNHITHDRYLQLKGKQANIFLSHDGPAGIGLKGRASAGLPADEMTGNGVPWIRELIEESGASFSFSGHWHCDRQAVIGETKHFALDKVDPEYPDARCMEVFEI